jgi:hypothetical protein
MSPFQFVAGVEYRLGETETGYAAVGTARVVAVDGASIAKVKTFDAVSSSEDRDEAKALAIGDAAKLAMVFCEDEDPGEDLVVRRDTKPLVATVAQDGEADIRKLEQQRERHHRQRQHHLRPHRPRPAWLSKAV